jgi:hypothetical protein
MKEKRQHKNKNQKMFYHHHGAVDISVAMGMPYSPVPVSGCQPTDLPGYSSHHQYTGSPSMQMFDPKTTDLTNNETYNRVYNEFTITTNYTL